MIENYLRKRENLTNVFVLIDSRHEPQKIDLAFINQLGKWEVPFVLLFTKADKETQRVVSKNVKSFLEAMRKEWQFLPQHIVTSSVKKMGREKILQVIERMNEGLNCKLTLISAPAGFGKTTLVSEWVAGNQRPTAWLFP